MIYVRYYVGHKGRFGHEFLEFEIRPDGRCRYANSSNYKNDTVIKKEMILSEQVLLEFKRIIEESNVLNLDDAKWPEPDSNGLQELELIIGKMHVCFVTSKIGSLLEVEKSKDPEGFEAFYYLVQDLKCFVLALISTHFKVKPI